MVICYNTAVKSHGLAHPSCGKRNIKNGGDNMKKKIIALALAAVMVVLTLGLASCTGGDNTDPAGEGGTNAAKNGTLTVGFDAEFPPMGFKDDNGLSLIHI